MTGGMRWDVESEVRSVFEVIWSRLTDIRDMCSNDDVTKDDIKARIESLIDEGIKWVNTTEVFMCVESIQEI